MLTHIFPHPLLTIRKFSFVIRIPLRTPTLTWFVLRWQGLIAIAITITIIYLILSTATVTMTYTVTATVAVSRIIY